MRLPVAAVIACPIRSALLLSPGRPFGQLVAILNSRTPCEIAGAGRAAALAITPARSIMLRRLTVAVSMHGTVSRHIVLSFLGQLVHVSAKSRSQQSPSGRRSAAPGRRAAQVLQEATPLRCLA